MPDFIRDLHVFLEGSEIARGCHLYLEARDTLTLRPALHRLEIIDLSDSSAALLREGRTVEVRSGLSVLSAGEIVEVFTHQTSGKRLTSLVFSPGLSLWQSSVSLSVAGGMKVSDTLRAILKAATGPSLSAFAAEDTALLRPQSFFGRACDALTLLAETVSADVFLSPAGVCVSGRGPREPTVILSKDDLLTAPTATASRLILTTSMMGWPLGAMARVDWEGASWTGRIVSRLLQADNTSGPWKAELELAL